ncbi:MAG: hypothetical protein EOM20_04520 [Spartobacteria bacterium]|nr:hypothetical protein [Spartobacteria bacterium]
MGPNHLTTYNLITPGMIRLNSSRKIRYYLSMNMRIIFYVGCVLLLGRMASAEVAPTPDGKGVVTFSYETNIGYGNELFVVGNHPDLGAWNPVQARKLYWTAGNVWTGNVAVTDNNDLEYKYIVRTNDQTNYCDEGNVQWMEGDNLQISLPARSNAPYSGKNVYYYSGWTNASLLYQCGADTNWHDVAMQRLRDGRTPTESLYRAEHFGKSGERLVFVPHGYASGNPEEQWDHCPISGIDDYFTSLDVFLLQDGQIYNYWPPAEATPSTIVTQYIGSFYEPTISARYVRVYIPRNYQQNNWKHYPVLYMHDGQNDFRPGGVFGCWDAEITADDMISLGLMRETLIVAVDNTDNRLQEYLAPTDSYSGNTGTADLYLKFLADNVKPYMDWNYRTLPDQENTATLGSSFGGIVSIYLGLGSNVFGKVGVMSPSFWAVPNFIEQYIEQGDSSGLRIYLDCGTDEDGGGDADMFPLVWEVYNLLMADGHVVNDTLNVQIGCGHPHSEWAWADRLYMAVNFLLNARDEANLIVQNDDPPQATGEMSASNFDVTFTAYKGFDYLLQRTTSLLSPAWNNVATGRLNGLMWDSLQLTDSSNATSTGAFYRVESISPSP